MANQKRQFIRTSIVNFSLLDRLKLVLGGWLLQEYELEVDCGDEDNSADDTRVYSINTKCEIRLPLI